MNSKTNIIQNQSGFSLIETLLAVFILSVISLISLNIMSSFADANQMVTNKTSQMDDIEKARHYLRADLKNAFSHQFLLGASIEAEDDRLFGLSRANSEISMINDNWSTAETIEYRFVDKKLIRRSYDRPNAMENTDFRDYVLLENISDISLRYYDGQFWQEKWISPSNGSAVYPPRAIEISWRIDNAGDEQSLEYVNRFQFGGDR